MPHDARPIDVDLIKGIINTMFLLMKHLRIYDAKNALVVSTTSGLQKLLASYLHQHKRLSLKVARHGFIFEDAFVERSNKTFETFAYNLFQHGICTVTIERGVAVHDLHTFLSLVGRPHSESWEEGGMARALQLRQIEAVQVDEMSESALALSKGGPDVATADDASAKSPLWDRFAFAVLDGLHSGSLHGKTAFEDVAPENLARMTSQLFDKLSAAGQQEFTKGLSGFLASLQHENIPLYRHRALAKLTDFINQLAPGIREKLFRNIFNLNMPPSFAAEFCSGLSDEIIIGILETATKQQGYVPPVILKVLGKIARDKQLGTGESQSLDRQLSGKHAAIEKLFKKDDFEKYVPEKYRAALLNIIQTEQLPSQSEAIAATLKRSLEESEQERHSAEVILAILWGAPETGHLKGLDENLAVVLGSYLENGHFKELYTLCRTCLSSNRYRTHFRRLRETLTSEPFLEQLVDSIARHRKRSMKEIEALIKGIGDPCIEPLLDKLSEETSRAHRMLYLQMLQKLNGKSVARQAVTRLKDRRWFFVRNIIYLLRVLNDPQVMPYLKPLKQHPHPTVRMDALKACLQFGCKEAQADLLTMLAEGDAKTLGAAISLAPMAPSSEVIMKMLERLRENLAFNFQLEQKKALVMTLTEIAQEAALPAFAKLLATKNLMHPRQHHRLRKEILSALSRFDSARLDAARELLLTSTRGKTRQQIQLILNRRSDHES